MKPSPRRSAAYQGGLVGATVENATSWGAFVANSLPWLVARAAGVMMIGMALFKWGFFSAKAPAWVYGVFLALGAAAFGLIAWQASINAAHGFAFMHMQTIGTFANSALAIFGSLFYASLFSLMVKAGALGFITSALAAVGRMAFTNYITQSLIMTTIFWGGRGFGLYGEVDRADALGYRGRGLGAQLIWSPLWLLRFKMGPLEWVWRRLSLRTCNRQSQRGVQTHEKTCSSFGHRRLRRAAPHSRTRWRTPPVTPLSSRLLAAALFGITSTPTVRSRPHCRMAQPSMAHGTSRAIKSASRPPAASAHARLMSATRMSAIPGRRPALTGPRSA